MNRLSCEKQRAVIALLCEGSSIRSAERLTGVHRDTICRLLVRVGKHCEFMLDNKMRGLRCESLQADEIWTFVNKKQKAMELEDPFEYGDAYLYTAIDRNTKLCPSFKIGKRCEETTEHFIFDLSERIEGRVQITTDGYPHYRRAIPRHFGGRADFMQLVKNYGDDPMDEHRYSPGRIRSVDHVWVQGFPDPKLVSTSHVERANLSIRTSMRRFARLTLSFSKKLENLKAACALYFAWYNFVRIHRSLRTTPAMAAGIAGSAWSVSDLIP